MFASHVDQTDLTRFILSHAGKYFIIDRLEGGIINGFPKTRQGSGESYDM